MLLEDASADKPLPQFFVLDLGSHRACLARLEPKVADAVPDDGIQTPDREAADVSP
jgi:hypothetical protein